MTEKMRYNDDELQEFKELILAKLEKANSTVTTPSSSSALAFASNFPPGRRSSSSYSALASAGRKDPMNDE